MSAECPEVGDAWLVDGGEREIIEPRKPDLSYPEGGWKFKGGCWYTAKCFRDGNLTFIRGPAPAKVEWKIGQRRRVQIMDLPDKPWRTGVLEPGTDKEWEFDLRKTTGDIVGAKPTWPSELLQDVDQEAGFVHLDRNGVPVCGQFYNQGSASRALADVTCPECREVRRKWEMEPFKDVDQGAAVPARPSVGAPAGDGAAGGNPPPPPSSRPTSLGMSSADIALLVRTAAKGNLTPTRREAPKESSEAELADLANPRKRRRS